MGRNVRERLRLGGRSRYRRKENTSTLIGREGGSRKDENGGGSGSGYKEGSGRLLSLRLGSGVMRRGEPLVSLLGARWAISFLNLINLPLPLGTLSKTFWRIFSVKGGGVPPLSVKGFWAQ